MTASTHRSPTRTGRRALTLLVLSTLLALAGCAHHASTSDSSTPAPLPPSISSLHAVSPPFPVSARYRCQVEDAMASGLHMTRAALSSQLRGAPGFTIMNLAKPLGIAEDQLALAIRKDLTRAIDAAVQSGTWTSRQARDEKRFWASQSDGSLITEISAWYIQT